MMGKLHRDHRFHRHRQHRRDLHRICRRKDSQSCKRMMDELRLMSIHCYRVGCCRLMESKVLGCKGLSCIHHIRHSRHIPNRSSRFHAFRSSSHLHQQQRPRRSKRLRTRQSKGRNICLSHFKLLTSVINKVKPDQNFFCSEIH